jgi:hypothetical protein
MTPMTALVRGGSEAGSEGIRPAGTGQPDAGGPSAGGSALDRVPVFRAGELAGFVRRNVQYREPPRSRTETDPQLSSDARLRRDIEAVMQTELGQAAEYIRMSVTAGVVGLSGEVANVHDKMALRRIVASMGATIAIVDDVWISCE